MKTKTKKTMKKCSQNSCLARVQQLNENGGRK